MNFMNMMQPLSQQATFSMPDYYVWCPSIMQSTDGRYYLFFSRWPKTTGFQGWVTHSEIAYAIADEPMGPYSFEGVVLGKNDMGWDRDVAHNPKIFYDNGMYYLYYMGTYGPTLDEVPVSTSSKIWWDYRNNQRIGVATASHPEGPWHRQAEPVIDVRSGLWDSLMTSNPTICKGSEDTYVLMYKGVSDKEQTGTEAVNAGVAFSKHPMGPFTRMDMPVISNPEHAWAVEDPFIWYQDGRYYGLIKDFNGYYTGGVRHTVGLFESKDAISWAPAQHPLAFRRELVWEDGSVTPVTYLERPHIYFEDNVASILICAVLPNEEQLSMLVFIQLQPEASEDSE
ncbi:Glycosyl hydrolases family 43 [compost metagenome]